MTVVMSGQGHAPQLTRPGGPVSHLSASGAYAILRRHGLSSRWERLARTEIHGAAALGLVTERMCAALRAARETPRHVEAARPGALVCLDMFYLGNLKGLGKIWQFTACDAACSYAVAWLTTELSARSARRFLGRYLLLFYRHAGHRVQGISTDGGSEFRGAFDHACAALGIEHRRTRPRHAWTNGFVERLQGTILSELWRCAFRRTYYLAVAPMQQALDRYLHFYNFERPYQGCRLRGRTPAEAFHASA